MSSKFSNTFVVLVSLILIMSVMASCTSPTPIIVPTATQEPLSPTEASPTETPQPEPVTITYWEWRGGALAQFMESEAALFHEKYPWITLTVSQFPDRNAYQDALNLAFESGDSPDVFIRTRSLIQTVSAGWAQPLDPWIAPEWKERFPEGTFVNTTTMLDGKIYSFPAFASGANRMLFINEDLFRTAGLVDANGEIRTPKTWGDLREMAKQITQAGNGEFYGIGIGIKDSRAMSWWFDLPCLAGAPMTPYDFDFRTGEYVYGTHPAYAQIVELLLGMKADRSVYPFESTIDDSNLYTFFGQGKFAIAMSGPYMVSNLRKDFPDFQNYRVVTLPVPDAGQTGNIYLLPSSGTYLLSAQTKHPSEAALWIDWLSSRDYNQRMVAATSNFSIYADLNSPENIKDDHVLQAYEALKTYGIYAPYPPARNPAASLVSPDAITPDVGDLLIGIYTGQIEDWKAALTDLDTRKRGAWDAALEKAQSSGAAVTQADFIFPDWNPMENYVTLPQE